ncbi:MAG TPA: T6SS effector amidase Tae4 family protein [Pyrinomonadaceae bacterium]|nr:T6SS effector amidase Tae4 family protein [Pyrinomonadaceae bacterium]
MPKKLPSYSLLAIFYLGEGFKAEEVRRLAGGSVDDPKLKNTCIIRISRPLNYLGHPIPVRTEPFRTRQGSDKLWYGLRVKEFWDYMIKIYGPPTVTAKKPFDRRAFADIKGIIGFRVSGWKDATGHFTLWNGQNLAYGEKDHDYFAISDEAALWEAGPTRTLIAPA